MTVYSTNEIEQVISLLRAGAVGAFPTDTVYGLGARADNDEAVLRVFCIKKRPREMALPLLLFDSSQINLVSDDIPAAARLLAGRFWPGGLTMVLPRSNRVSPLVSGGKDTVAVRVPDCAVTLRLIRGAGVPLVGTSANLTGRPSPLNAREVVSQLGGEVDFVLDGGDVSGGVESTIIDITGAQPLITRAGAVAADAISSFLTCNGIQVANPVKG